MNMYKIHFPMTVMLALVKQHSLQKLSLWMKLNLFAFCLSYFTWRLNTTYRSKFYKPSDQQSEWKYDLFLLLRADMMGFIMNVSYTNTHFEYKVQLKIFWCGIVCCVSYQTVYILLSNKNDIFFPEMIKFQLYSFQWIIKCMLQWI